MWEDQTPRRVLRFLDICGFRGTRDLWRFRECPLCRGVDARSYFECDRLESFFWMLFVLISYAFDFIRRWGIRGWLVLSVD